MNRQDAYQFLLEKLKNKNLIKHSLAVEACLRKMSQHFGEDEEIWSMAGLLHDIDYEQTNADPARHGLEGAQLLAQAGYDESIVRAVKAHSGHLAADSKLDWALFCADPLTGLIVAAALMHPDKKLAALDAEFVLRRYKEKRFAAGANREQIAMCKNLGFELEQFIDICLGAMQSIAGDLGL